MNKVSKLLPILAAALSSIPLAAAIQLGPSPIAVAQVKTWDGKHNIEKIDLTAVYFVPSDRQPLVDWRARAEFHCRRVKLFHSREFQGQSTLHVKLHPEPFVSRLTTAELRRGSSDAIFFRTLREVDERIQATQEKQGAFPILLVLSEINWRPLDDFYRLKPQDGRLVFEGNYNGSEHFPGAASGGARATYLADKGAGWGLVSADGWRVPYRGADCVVYHEGCGHTVGLPHPQPGNGSVMSLGQYQGWLNESWLDREQKLRLGWRPDEEDPPANPQLELFTKFRALARPPVPRPGQQVTLALDWPEDAEVESLRVRFQTSVEAPWIDAPQDWQGDAPKTAVFGPFDRETPVSYRVDAELKNGAAAEVWGYFQVRSDAGRNPQPYALSPDLIERDTHSDADVVVSEAPDEEVDLLAMIEPKSCWQTGDWTMEAGKLVSPKQYGARLEIPYSPPQEYRLTLIVEPLSEPNGLIVGQRSGESRFLTLLNYTPDSAGLCAIENVGGRNVGNETTFEGDLLQKNRLSQAIITVKRGGVKMTVDGRTILHWRGTPKQLSLSEYWATPNEAALFVGAYDCRYRFHRITIEPITGEGRPLNDLSAKEG